MSAKVSQAPTEAELVEACAKRMWEDHIQRCFGDMTPWESCASQDSWRRWATSAVRALTDLPAPTAPPRKNKRQG